MELLSKIGPTTTDRVFFVGDIINKGPDSKKVIEEVRQNNYQTVLGNHEWAYLKRYNSWKQNSPITPFFQSQRHPLLNSLLEILTEEENFWIDSLPFYYDTPEFLLVHAGIFPDRNLFDHEPHELLNVRTIQGRPWHDYYWGKKIIVYGHWAMQGLMVKENSIGLDSGCVYGGKLSALILPEKKIVQVNSRTSVF